MQPSQILPPEAQVAKVLASAGADALDEHEPARALAQDKIAEGGGEALPVVGRVAVTPAGTPGLVL